VAAATVAEAVTVGADFMAAVAATAVAVIAAATEVVVTVVACMAVGIAGE
jgi:hypothetical protein